MSGYFKPVRRKIGVATLVLACVFAVGWVRSSYKYDMASFNGKPWKFIAGSFLGKIYLAQSTFQKRLPYFWFSFNSDFKTFRDLTITRNGTQTFNLSGLLSRHDAINWRWDWAGFHMSDGIMRGGRMRICLIPYWSIVIPLTLLSAWLLLSRSRRKPEPPIPTKD